MSGPGMGIPLGIPMSDFFRYMNALEQKWDAKFMGQEEKNKELNKKLSDQQERIDKIWEDVKEENKLQLLLREYDSARHINGHITDSNTKIALASYGIATGGAAMMMIPVVGKIEETDDHRLVRCIREEKVTLFQAKAAQAYFKEWCEKYPYDWDESFNTHENHKERQSRFPREYDFSNDLKIKLHHFYPSPNPIGHNFV
jgi:hypothetical protein